MHESLAGLPGESKGSSKPKLQGVVSPEDQRRLSRTLRWRHSVSNLFKTRKADDVGTQVSTQASRLTEIRNGFASMRETAGRKIHAKPPSASQSQSIHVANGNKDREDGKQAQR